MLPDLKTQPSLVIVVVFFSLKWKKIDKIGKFGVSCFLNTFSTSLGDAQIKKEVDSKLK